MPKKTLCLFAASVLVFASGCTSTPYEPSRQSIQDTTRTGSRLPQEPSADRVSKDGPQRVRTIDQEEIDSTGATTITDVLRRTGNNY